MVTATINTNILERIQSRSPHPWLLDHHGAPLTSHFTDTVEHCYNQLQATPTDARLIIADPNPVQFLAKFLAACAAQRTIFLGNTQWVQSEWDHVQAIAHPTHTWLPSSSPTHLTPHSPTPPLPHSPTPSLSKLPPNAILIPTGGTSGSIRFAIHTWETLTASVTGFCQHFQVDTVNTCCVLPLYHVSGLMQFMRSFLSNGQMALPTFKALEEGTPLGILPERFFLSLVPTQLARLCNRPAHLDWLQSFQAILLGGAPPWPDLLAMGHRYHLPLAPTYGMTETASQVATLRPQEFSQRKSSVSSTTSSTTSGKRPKANPDNNAGSVLPHATITIRDPSGKALGPNQTGMITIQSSSLALGYCSDTGTEWFRGSAQDVHSSQAQSMFHSNDLGFFDDDGYLHVVGRQQDMIISGGENISPADVEAAIRSTGLVSDVAVLGVRDRLWGEAVTAIYVPVGIGDQGSRGVGEWGSGGVGEQGSEGAGDDMSLSEQDAGEAAIKVALSQTLNRIKHPKHWIAVTALPCNAQGKVNRSELEAIAQTHLAHLAHLGR